MSNLIFVDVEADGPCPGLYSMVSFGAVLYKHNDDFSYTFYGECSPLPDAQWIESSLKISNTTREQHLSYVDPEKTMFDFAQWLASIQTDSNDRLIFMSDNNGFDWQFINYYFWKYNNSNPFGHSSVNMSNLYQGYVKNMFKNHRHLRKTKHTHNPVDDAIGNAEAFLHLKEIESDYEQHKINRKYKK